jgi:nucleotide-binding universal stress UspA family protein
MSVKCNLRKAVDFILNNRQGEKMATQILVPLDGSPLSEQALPWAITLGQGLAAELVLFGAVSIPPDTQEILDNAGMKTDALAEQLEAEANDHLGKVVERLREAGLNARHVVQRGPAAEAIVGFAEKEDIQHIVMATHGYTGISRWTHGSVAERVLQSASVPVLLVRAKAGALRDLRQPMSCQRILVPLDGSARAEQVLPAVIPIASALGSEMILFQVPIVHVSGWSTGEWFMPLDGVLATADQSAQAYLSYVANRHKKQGVKVSTATRMGPVAESIVEHAEANRVDLIAMCTHGRTGLGRWVLGSVADRVLRAGSIPIFLVRAR